MTEGSMDRAGRASEQAGQEWLDTLRSRAEQIQKQQQYSQQMTQELINTYMQLLNTPGSYLSGQAEQQQQTLQQTAQQWMEQAQPRSTGMDSARPAGVPGCSRSLPLVGPSTLPLPYRRRRGG
jgi:hypothetical protein